MTARLPATAPTSGRGRQRGALSGDGRGGEGPASERGLPPAGGRRRGPRRNSGGRSWIAPARRRGRGAGLADSCARLARPALRAAIRAADPEHARTARQRDVRPAARSVAAGLPVAERSHNRIVEAMEAALPGGASAAPWRAWKGGTAPAAMRCAPRCSAPMTGWCPTSAW